MSAKHLGPDGGKRRHCALARDVLHNRIMIRLPARWWVGSLVAVGLLGWAGAAAAQSVTIGQVTRARTINDTRPNTLYISRADCLAGDQFFFPITLSSNYTSYTFEVWAGPNCSDRATRYNTSSPTCWKVAEGATSTATTEQIAVQAMVATTKANGTGSIVVGTVDDCTPTQTTMKPEDLTLTFMLVNPSTNDYVAGATWSTKYDLVGPPAPTGVTAGLGETMLKVTWTPPSDLTDLTSYQLYCFPIRGQESTSAADAGITTMGLDAGDLDVVIGPDAAAGSDASDDAGAGTGGASGDDASAGTGGTAGAAGTGGAADAGVEASLPANCPAGTPFAEGATPDDTYVQYQCGTASVGTEATVKGLVDGVTYAVAVSGLDSVGNAGPLSNVACEAPGPIDDFFDLYKQAGGTGGGGFCSLSGVPGRARHAGLAGSIVFLAAAALMRRRSRR